MFYISTSEFIDFYILTCMFYISACKEDTMMRLKSTKAALNVQKSQPRASRKRLAFVLLPGEARRRQKAGKRRLPRSRTLEHAGVQQHIKELGADFRLQHGARFLR
jgi:hypothetical protein